MSDQSPYAPNQKDQEEHRPLVQPQETIPAGEPVDPKDLPKHETD